MTRKTKTRQAAINEASGKLADAILYQDCINRLMPRNMLAMQDDIGTVAALTVCAARFNSDIFDAYQALADLLESKKGGA